MNKHRGKRGDKVLFSHANSGCGKIELMTMRPDGAAMADMMLVVGCAKKHIRRLIVEEGIPIVLENGRYYYRPVRGLLIQQNDKSVEQFEVVALFET